MKTTSPKPWDELIDAHLVRDPVEDPGIDRFVLRQGLADPEPEGPSDQNDQGG